MWLMYHFTMSSCTIAIDDHPVGVNRHQDIRQCHFPGDQNRAEDCYEEEAYNPNKEGQHVFQSLSPD